VSVAVKLNLHATRRPDLENENIELVVIELAIENSKTGLLYTFYRPPDSGHDVFQHLNLSLQNTSESTCTSLLETLIFQQSIGLLISQLPQLTVDSSKSHSVT
jgi:hypothetical protein